MHYFENLGLGLDPNIVVEFHIGQNPPTTNWLGNPKSDGKIIIKLVYKTGTVKVITREKLNREAYDLSLDKIRDELSSYFCNITPKIAKEDPTENVINAEPKPIIE
jgi:hypothetical protein